MKAVIYYTAIPEKYQGKNREHFVGEKLLEAALLKETGRKLSAQPRKKGPQGKPFFADLSGIHYNISHSGKYVLCIFSRQEVGIDIQEHRKAKYDRMLKRMVPESRRLEILGSPRLEQEFFREWAAREAYVKWTGQGLSMDFTRIPMEEGWHAVTEFRQGYTVAVWGREKMEIQWEYVEVLDL